MNPKTWSSIRRLVGNITREELRHVDCALAENLGVFTPITGPCYYARKPDHRHPAHSFVLAFDGTMGIRVGDRVIPPRPGYLCALEAELPHQEIPGDTPSRYIAVMIHSHYFTKVFGAYSPAKLPRLEGQYFQVDPRLVRTLKDFLAEHEAAKPGYQDVLEALGLSLTHQIIRCILGIRSEVNRIARRMDINDGVEYFHHHMADPVTVADMAHAAHLSVSHFSRQFRQELGVRPKAYMQKSRLSHAKRMLQQNEYTVTEVALACGFASSAHFTSSFRRAFSMPPSAYRRLWSE